MPTYSDLKDAIVAIAEVSGDARLRAALGDQGSSAPWPTVVVATVDDEDLRALVGSAWGPPADPLAPEDGPDPATLDKTVIAAVVQGVADYLDAEWKPRINAAISRINTEHSTSLEEVP